MAEGSIKIEEQLGESNWELQKTQCELQVDSGASFDAQHLVLSKAEEARSFLQKLNGVEAQIDLAREKVISIQAACAEIAVRSKREFVHLQKKCYLRQQCMAEVRSLVTFVNQELEVVTVNTSV